MKNLILAITALTVLLSVNAFCSGTFLLETSDIATNSLRVHNPSLPDYYRIMSAKALYSDPKATVDDTRLIPRYLRTVISSSEVASSDRMYAACTLGIFGTEVYSPGAYRAAYEVLNITQGLERENLYRAFVLYHFRLPQPKTESVCPSS